MTLVVFFALLLLLFQIHVIDRVIGASGIIAAKVVISVTRLVVCTIGQIEQSNMLRQIPYIVSMGVIVTLADSSKRTVLPHAVCMRRAAMVPSCAMSRLDPTSVSCCIAMLEYDRLNQSPELLGGTSL